MKRKEFTPKTKRLRNEHAQFRCEGILPDGTRCNGQLGEDAGNPIQHDHDKPCWMGGDNTFENCRAVGTTCCTYHKDKSAEENRTTKRCDRIRRKHSGYKYKKKKIKSRGFSKGPKQKIPYRKADGTMLWNGKP